MKMKTLSSISKILEGGKVAPIHPDYPYSNVGLMLFVGKMGSGKTNDVLKHVMITDSLGPNESPFYSKVVYSGSVGEDDETYTTFKKALKTPIISVPPNKLMEFLNEHLRVKKKYYAIYKYVMNDFKEPNKTMQRILDKHKTQFFGTRRIRNNKRVNTSDEDIGNDPKKQIALYALDKIIKYESNKYPAYLFIALNDAASSELKSKNDSPISRLLKVCRHMHISCDICVQSVHDSIKELKRLIGDVTLYRYVTHGDLEKTLEAIPTTHTIDEIEPIYRSLIGKHGKIT
jgi:hypothetical protein